MKNKKLTASVLSASMIATPMLVELNTINVMAANSQEVLYGQYDIETNEYVTQGLSLTFQDTGGGGEFGGYISDDFVIWKMSEKITEEAAPNYDYSKATKVTEFTTISFYENSTSKWVDDNGILNYNADGFAIINGQSKYSITGKPTFKSLEVGEYVLQYVGKGTLINHKTGYIPFTVEEGKCFAIDLEGVSGKIPEIIQELGNVSLKAIVVETDENGNIVRNEDGSFKYTDETVADVLARTDGESLLTDEIINQYLLELLASMGIDDTSILPSFILDMYKEQAITKLKEEGYTDAYTLSLKTDSTGTNTVNDIATGTYNMRTIIPEGYALADVENDETFSYNVEPGETAYQVIELYKLPEKDEDDIIIPTEIPQNIKVIVKDRETLEVVPGAGFSVKATNNLDFDFADISTIDGSLKTVLADTYTASLTSVPEGYILNNETTSVTLEKATIENTTTEMILYVDKEEYLGNLDIIIRDKDTKEPIPNATIVIVDKDGNETTTKTDKNGKVEQKDLPIGDYTIKVTTVPKGYNIPDNQKASVEKNTTTTVIFEIEKQPIIEKEEDKKEEIVQTGDDNKLSLFASLGLSSLVGIFLSLRKKEK